MKVETILAAKGHSVVTVKAEDQVSKLVATLASKGIGAVVPEAGRRPLGPAALRRVMAAYEAAGGTDQYQLLIGRVTRIA